MPRRRAFACSVGLIATLAGCGGSPPSTPPPQAQQPAPAQPKTAQPPSASAPAQAKGAQQPVASAPGAPAQPKSGQPPATGQALTKAGQPPAASAPGQPKGAPPAGAPAVTTPAMPTAPKGQYDVKGRRDPFENPDVVAKEREKATGGSSVVASAKLTGIVRGQTTLALVETADGVGYILKPGDTLGDGKLLEIGQDSATFSVVPKPGTNTNRIVLKIATE